MRSWTPRGLTSTRNDARSRHTGAPFGRRRFHELCEDHGARTCRDSSGHGARSIDQTTFDGIVYMSRITNRECVAVYDRAATPSLEADSPAIDLPRMAALPTIVATPHVTIVPSV